MSGLRITTWNVNGIRNPFSYHPWSISKDFSKMFDDLEADIVCIQELKIQQKDLRDDMVLLPEWDSFFTFPKHRKGYSGVAVYTRSVKCRPVKAEEGITGILEPPTRSGQSYLALEPSESIGGYPDISPLEARDIDSEGRALVLDFGAFVLIGTYCPAATDTKRDEFRITYVQALCTRVRNLVALGRHVVVVGDLNICRDEIDAAGAKEMMKEAGLERWKDPPTRTLLDKLLKPHEEGIMLDLCREYHPNRVGMYTHWDVFKNKRPGNYGTRIDYILCSQNMESWFCSADIQAGLMGSDHCPVYAELREQVNVDATAVPLHVLLEPSKVNAKLKLSAKSLPEFSRRRNIKDMFANAKSTSTPKRATEVSSQSKPVTTGNEENAPGSVSLDAGASESKKRRRLSQTHGPRPAKKMGNQTTLKEFCTAAQIATISSTTLNGTVNERVDGHATK